MSIVIWVCGACGGVMHHKPNCPLKLMTPGLQRKIWKEQNDGR